MKKMGIILFIILALLFAFPVVATVVNSFMTRGDTGIGFDMSQYADLFLDCFIFYPMFWSSLLYGVVITLLQLVVIIPCAFGFVNASFKGKNHFFTFYIMLMMMPLQVTILPNYIGLRDMGLIDTRMGIILPMVFSPFGVVVMHQYMKNIDGSIIEVARLETKSMVRIILVSVIPQIKVCVLAVAVFVFAECFNMLEQPMLFLKTMNIRTLSVFIANSGKYAGNVMFPTAVIFMIPILILYVLFKDSLDKGLTLGDVK